MAGSKEVLVRNAEVLAISVQENKKDKDKPYMTAYVFSEAGDRPAFYEVRLKTRDDVKLLDPHIRKKPVALVLDLFTWDKRDNYTFLGLLSEFMKAG